MRQKWFIVALVALLSASVFGEGMKTDGGVLNTEESPFETALYAELGFSAFIHHSIQFGQFGSTFDYMAEGGQDILFPFKRLEAEITLANRHTLVFLYQPILVTTTTKLQRDVTFYSTTFSSNSGMETKYSFPFYRLSYMYEIVNNDRLKFGVGLSLQLRNASITFESLDGTQTVVSENVGPVPVIKTRLNYYLTDNLFLGFVADGFYASSQIFNGSDIEFEGSILDTSLRFGADLNDAVSAYINLRYIGGTASGSNPNNNPPGEDGYTDNRLSIFNLSLGVILR